MPVADPLAPPAMHRFLHHCLNRTPIIGLLMAALLFRALIPAGFMPGRDADGAIVMELCSGLTTTSMAVQLGAPDDHGSAQDTNPALIDHSPCGFAATALAASPPTPFQFVPPSLEALPARLHLDAAPTPIARSQSPRGPPTRQG